jgi:hypothetical protein
MYINLHLNYPLFMSDINENLIFLDRFSENTQNFKIHENPTSGGRVVPCGRTDRWTDMMKLIAALQNFENAPKSAELCPQGT